MAEEQAVHMYEFGKGAQVGPRSGGRTGFNPGEKTAPTPGGKSATTPVGKSAPTPGEKFTQTPGGKSAPTPGEKSGQTSGEKSAPTPGEKSGQTSGEKTAPTPGGKSATTAGEKSASTPGGKTATTPGGKSATTAGEKTAPTPGGKSAPTPGEKSATTAGEKTATTAGEKSASKSGEKSASTKEKKSASSKTDAKTKLIGYDDENFATKEEKAEDLKRRFQPNNAKVVRKEMFANLYDPAVTIRNGNITFNTACIKGLEDVVYVHLLIDVQQGIFAVRGCNENDKDAVRWCTAKNDKRKPRRMTCSGFTDYLYKVMGWDTSCRYKVLGYRIEFDGEAMYVFDLGVPKTFHEKPKKGEERPDGETVDTRKGFFPDDIANSFGVPYEEHKKAQEVNVEDGMVTIGILTGGKREQQGSEEQSEEKQAGEKQAGGKQSGEKQSGEKYSGAQDKTRH